MHLPSLGSCLGKRLCWLVRQHKHNNRLISAVFATRRLIPAVFATRRLIPAVFATRKLIPAVFATRRLISAVFATRRLPVALVFFFFAEFAFATVQRWDALPALDVLHVQGAYAGQPVCPMCRHGYDAGVLAFMRSDVDVQIARSAAKRLQRLLGPARFRVFLVFTGAPPQPELLQAIESKQANWFVAAMSEQALAAAKLGTSSLSGPWFGFVFAQRRALWRFDSGASPAKLKQVSHYALQFLQETYGVAQNDANPDSPKGRLWLAPDRLSNVIDFAAAHSASNDIELGQQLCFRPADDGVEFKRAPMLLGLSAGRPRWARTDAAGCILLRNLTNIAGSTGADRALRVEVLRLLRPTALVHVNVAQFAQASRTTVYLGKPANKKVVGLPCEGCEAVFQGLPATLSDFAPLAPPGSPGVKLTIYGTVRDSFGKPAANIVVYAYQTDAAGHYPRDPALSAAAARHGRYRAWVQTNALGQYRFESIRPGSYPDSNIPQHVHMHIIEAGCTYYIDELRFGDDQQPGPQARGGSGTVTLKGDAIAGWIAQRDIVLGLGIPGYEKCAAPTVQH
jgi:protocatechuate 3,4-dioxygenase beta subunit